MKGENHMNNNKKPSFDEIMNAVIGTVLPTAKKEE